MMLLQDDVAFLPDLRPLEEKLASLKKAVYRAFPSFRWEASYNAISYRRVRVHLDMFKVWQFVTQYLQVRYSICLRRPSSGVFELVKMMPWLEICTIAFLFTAFIKGGR